jgi:hypothetical protein
VGRRALAIGTGSLATFWTVIPGVDVALLALTLCGIVALARPRAGGPNASRGRPALTVIGVGLLAAVAVVSLPMIRFLSSPGYVITAFTASSIRTVQVLLVLAAVALFARQRLERWLSRLREAMHTADADPRALVVCLVVTWAVCLLVVEYGRGERMSFLWPVQAVLLAAVARAVSKVASPALVLFVVMAGPVMTTATALRDSNWSGEDAEEVGIAGDVAGLIRDSKRSEASIGYQVFVADTWGSKFVASDPRYKIGADFDLLLAHPHGILNTDHCAEGISRRDEFRLVATRPPPNEALVHVEVPPDSSFRPVRTYETYELRQRR